MDSLALKMIVGEYKLLPRSVHIHVVNNDEHGYFRGENIQMNLFSIFKTETLVSRSTLHSGFNLFEVLSVVDLSNLPTFPSLWFIIGKQQGLCVNLDRPVRSIHENRMKKDYPRKKTKIARQESGRKRDADLSKDGDFFNERVAC